MVESTEGDTPGTGPMSGVRVLDLAHQYSGAFAANLLADMGADVITVEHPVAGSPIRTMLPKKGTESLWWKQLQRNKRNITLDLSKGQDLFRRLLASVDVVIENFRPGTLEKWGIGPLELEAAGFSLVLVRISGYGQTGPLSGQPGYGAAAEAMSGFAHLNGFPDGPPMLPSSTLADGVSAVFAAMGASAALYQAQRSPGGVRVVDVALVESLFRIVPSQVVAYDQLGVVLNRVGNSLIEKGVLRNIYRSKDGQYFTIGGGVGERSVGRTLSLVGADDLVARLSEGALNRPMPEVVEFLREGDSRLARWAEKTPYQEAAALMRAHDVVFAAVDSAEQVMHNEQLLARDDIIKVHDDQLGDIAMPGVVPKFTGYVPGPMFAGRDPGAHNDDVYAELAGLTPGDLAELRERKVI
jgi:crotonobetainyl-CoA:carnitine CoA-transferase CaiB-like acyl-CoA transferase